MKYCTVKIGVVAAAIAVSSAALGAQARNVKCALPDTTKEWFKLQREWLDDSKHAWTNDSLRMKVMIAAGLDPAKQVGVQYGWTTLDSPPRDSSAAAILRP